MRTNGESWGADDACLARARSRLGSRRAPGQAGQAPTHQKPLRTVCGLLLAAGAASDPSASQAVEALAEESGLCSALSPSLFLSLSLYFSLSERASNIETGWQIRVAVC